MEAHQRHRRNKRNAIVGVNLERIFYGDGPEKVVRKSHTFSGSDQDHVLEGSLKSKPRTCKAVDDREAPPTISPTTVSDVDPYERRREALCQVPATFTLLFAQRNR